MTAPWMNPACLVAKRGHDLALGERFLLLLLTR